MFKLLALTLNKHPSLGSLQLNFVDANEEGKGPYTTLLIGANGTGKSNILRVIIDIFREMSAMQVSDKKYYVPATYYIKYKIDDDYYEFQNHSKAEKDGIHVAVPAESHTRKNGAHIDISKMKLPKKIIANAIMLNDKFPMVPSKPEDIYQYMGIRRSPSTAGTQTSIRRTVSNIAEAIDGDDFKKDLSDILDFLNLKHKLYVYYYPKYKHYFFKGDLTIKKFKAFFENWKEITKRKTEPWSLKYYNNIKDRDEEIEDLIKFINFITSKLKYESARTQYFQYDIFSSNDLKNDFELLKKLSSFDLLYYPSLGLERESEGDSDYELESSSSGEYHFLVSMLSMIAKIKEDSLILIDEPEISLHPNWQIKYINFLKKIFGKYKSAHFIIASHSHFLVSDLEKDTSSIIGLTRDTPESPIKAELIESNTYGWSAEDVLYNIFGAATTRNLYLANEIGDLLKEISTGDYNSESINNKIRELNRVKLQLKDVDPLKAVIEKLNKKFLASQDDKL
ncbi:MAG: AAA family ATPase [Candidatus Omnitrophica bacterium]|nr:AAA family ATPase [Candidatus Omnitrophota bacterium]